MCSCHSLLRKGSGFSPRSTKANMGAMPAMGRKAPVAVTLAGIYGRGKLAVQDVQLSDRYGVAWIRTVVGVLGVTCLQVVLALGATWVKFHTTAHWLTILLPGIIVLAGFAHFRILRVIAGRRVVRIILSVAATLFSTYWMMFALLNTFGS